jgi:hypothetical protein
MLATLATRIKAVAALLLFFIAASTAAQDARNLQRIQAPGRSWALEIDVGNFMVRQNVASADGSARRLQAEIESDGYILTVMVSPASTRRVSSKDLRDLAAERLKAEPAIRRDDFKSSERGQTPTLEYFVREHKSQPVNQKHLNAYISRDEIWIDVHFSKSHFRDGDEKLFYAVLETLRFTDTPKR